MQAHPRQAGWRALLQCHPPGTPPLAQDRRRGLEKGFRRECGAAAGSAPSSLWPPASRPHLPPAPPRPEHLKHLSCVLQAGASRVLRTGNWPEPPPWAALQGWGVVFHPHRCKPTLPTPSHEEAGGVFKSRVKGLHQLLFRSFSPPVCVSLFNTFVVEPGSVCLKESSHLQGSIFHCMC